MRSEVYATVLIKEAKNKQWKEIFLYKLMLL